MSQVFCDLLEILQRGLTLQATRLEGSFEAMADMVMDQRLLRAFDGALDRLQLLSDLSAWQPAEAGQRRVLRVMAATGCAALPWQPQAHQASGRRPHDLRIYELRGDGAGRPQADRLYPAG
jgi:hypothetical protein